MFFFRNKEGFDIRRTGQVAPMVDEPSGWLLTIWLTLKTIWLTIYGNDLGNHMVDDDYAIVK